VLEPSQHGEPNFQRGDICYEQEKIHKNFNENKKNNSTFSNRNFFNGISRIVMKAENYENLALA